MSTVYLAAISPSSCWNYSEKFKNTFAFSIVSKNWTIRTAKFFLHMRQCYPYLAHSKFRLLIACRRNGPWYWPRYFGIFGSWWRHQMEIFSTLLVICMGNSPVPGEFPAQRPVARSFNAFFDLRLNKRLSKQSRGWWFETLSCPLWRQRNVSAPKALRETHKRHTYKFEGEMLGVYWSGRLVSLLNITTVLWCLVNIDDGDDATCVCCSVVIPTKSHHYYWCQKWPLGNDQNLCNTSTAVWCGIGNTRNYIQVSRYLLYNDIDVFIVQDSFECVLCVSFGKMYAMILDSSLVTIQNDDCRNILPV